MLWWAMPTLLTKKLANSTFEHTPENLCWAVPALRLRSVTAVAEGFRYRSTQPTNFYNVILFVSFFLRFHINQS